MAGIYLHIPFCKSRCIYCNFYSTTIYSKWQLRYTKALCRELTDRKEYLKGTPIHTIYFGGGTPSQLDIENLRLIINCIETNYDTRHCEEITIEVNPDDITKRYLERLKTLPINRISMGIQTFDDKTLKFINRRHNADEAIQAFKRCKDEGFDNISIDLIYGFPGETLSQWEYDIEKTISLRPSHISAYNLTYEKDTPLEKMYKNHLVDKVGEQYDLSFYTLLMDKLKSVGYEHYEISNFCLPKLYSRHNSSYWQGVPYLGCGAAAHSFNGSEREWNIANLVLYIKGIENGKRNYESELLPINTRYNEFVMTSLRTSRGIDTNILLQRFGKYLYDYCIYMAKPYLNSRKLDLTNGFIRLSRNSIFISDDIISDLFFTEN